MYKQRKNFLSYQVPSVDAKKAEAKKILSSILESSTIADLDSLYQSKEFDQSKRVDPKDLPFSQPAASNLEPVSDTLLTVGKLPTEGGTVVIGVKKPVQVIFKDESATNPLKEDITIVEDDDVLAPVEEAPIEVQKKLEDEDYDCLDSAPPLDLSSDLQNTILQRGQGMITSVQKSNNILAPVAMQTRDHIKGIEDDIEGYSVVGLDNDIGMNMLK
jgi:hypothetical protein